MFLKQLFTSLTYVVNTIHNTNCKYKIKHQHNTSQYNSIHTVIKQEKVERGRKINTLTSTHTSEVVGGGKGGGANGEIVLLPGEY